MLTTMANDDVLIIRLPRELKAKLERECRRRGLIPSRVLRELMAQWLADSQREESDVATCHVCESVDVTAARKVHGQVRWYCERHETVADDDTPEGV